MRQSRETSENNLIGNNHAVIKTGILRFLKLSLSRHKTGELLVLRGLISPTQLRDILTLQRDTRKPFGQICIECGYLKQHQLWRLLVGQRALRVLAAATFYFSSLVAFNKPTRAEPIKDVPARITLASATYNDFDKLKHYPALFGAQEKKSNDLKAFTKWTGMFERFERELDQPSSQKIITDMKRELAGYASSSLYKMADRVNDMMNRQRYITDQTNWGQSDYWATPIEFLTRGGDCEDYAIAKYVALRVLGVPEHRLRIAIVQDEEKNTPHAILIVYTEKGPMVLDNQIKAMRAVHNISHYRPIFSINRHAWWLHTRPNNANTIVASAE